MAILITGGSTGIGRGVGVHFAGHGDDVFINYSNNDEAAHETAELVRTAGGTAHLVKGDIATLAGVRDVIRQVRDRTDVLHQIVHCAAVSVRGPLLEVAGEDVDRAVAVNGTALVHVVREALELLQRGSCVFYVTSRGGRIFVPNYGAMGIPKALGDHIVRYLAVELAPLGIRANIISPGALDTPTLRAVFPETYEERLRIAADANPSGRGITFDDVAGVIERLSDPEFEMVQGQYISVDGGNSL